MLREIQPNSIINVLVAGVSNSKVWLFANVPAYDIPVNNFGWIKEEYTVEFTKELPRLVQSDVKIKAGTEIIQGFDDEGWNYLYTDEGGFMIDKHRKPVIFSLLILGAAGIADTFFLLLSHIEGMNVGTLFPGLIGLIFIFSGIVKLRLKPGKRLITSKPVRRLLLAGIAFWLLTFVIIESLIIISGNSDKNARVDYLIILGAGVNGEELSLTLSSRMYKGLEYLRENPAVKVIVSGGQGPGERISEAEAMKRFLYGNGVDEDRIIKEDKSTSTMENFKFSKEILEKIGAPKEIRVMVLTNDFHMFRAKMLARRNGLIPYGLACSTPAPVALNCYIREYFALVKSFFVDRID